MDIDCKDAIEEMKKRSEDVALTILEIRKFIDDDKEERPDCLAFLAAALACRSAIKISVTALAKNESSDQVIGRLLYFVTELDLFLARASQMMQGTDKMMAKINNWQNQKGE